MTVRSGCGWSQISYGNESQNCTRKWGPVYVPCDTVKQAQAGHSSDLLETYYNILQYYYYNILTAGSLPLVRRQYLLLVACNAGKPVIRKSRESPAMYIPKTIAEVSPSLRCSRANEGGWQRRSRANEDGWRPANASRSNSRQPQEQHLSATQQYKGTHIRLHNPNPYTGITGYCKATPADRAANSPR